MYSCKDNESFIVLVGVTNKLVDVFSGTVRVCACSTGSSCSGALPAVLHCCTQSGHG